MFDIGFSELMVIAVVALVVIGPERLPRVARTLGHLFGRLQRYVNEVKSDISREMELEELRKFKNEFENAASSVETQIRAEMNQAESAFTGLADEASLKPEIEKTEAELAALSREVSGDPHEPVIEPAVEPTVKPAAEPAVEASVEPASAPIAVPAVTRHEPAVAGSSAERKP